MTTDTVIVERAKDRALGSVLDGVDAIQANRFADARELLMEAIKDLNYAIMRANSKETL